MHPRDHSQQMGDPVPAGDRLEAPCRRDPGLPYATELRMAPGTAWVCIGIFLALITLPGLVREASSDAVHGALGAVFRPGDEPVVERLRAAEKRIEDGAWTKPLRAVTQSAVFGIFREGNRKVLAGKDGWLFHRPGVQSLTGRGPVLGPTHSVAKDPSLRKWEGPIPVIRAFGAQLKERGIRLLFVPVPDKAALWSAHLPGTWTHDRPATTRLRHPDWPHVVRALGDAVEVVDLDAALPYLRDDTHWEAEGARAAAATIAAAVRGGTGAAPAPLGAVELVGHGDLVASLGLAPSFAARLATTVRIPMTQPVVSDAAATTVVLGDSNVNMFDDAGLPFHQPGAGLASWLQAALGEPLHVMAINGGGATQVRQRFAMLADDEVRAKRTVVWVMAERDLLMDPAVARAQGVEWKHVVFNPRRATPVGEPSASAVEALVIEATLRGKSRVLDMESVNYPDAVFTAEFTVDRVVAGTYTEAELAVVLWNFRDRVVQPSARLSPGQRVRLTLVSWLAQGELTKINLEDDFQRFDLPLFYAEKAEIIDP